jgi:O-antigen/teichoic acid export membrane protein
MLLAKGLLQRRPVLAIGLAGVLAQVLNAVLTPVLARIYSPAQFGLFAIYYAFMAIIAVISSLRYELAIPLPAERSDAVHLLRVAFWLSQAWALVLFALGLGFPGSLVPPLDGLRPIWGITCLGVASIGMYQAITAWALREQDYLLLAGFRCQQGALQPASKLGLGWCGQGAGLILGDVLGRWAANLALVWGVRAELFAWPGRADRAAWWRQMGRYRAFPLVSGPSGILNALGLYLPMLLFARLFSADRVGLFGLAQTLIGLPVLLIGQGMTQVYTGQAAELVRRGDPGLSAYLRGTLRKLLLVGAAPVLLVAGFGPALFALVFGPKWQGAGDYVRLLTPMYLAQFVASPVSGTTYLLEAQGVQLLWDGGRVLVLGLWFALATVRAWNDRTALLMFSLFMGLMYLINIVLVLTLARSHPGGSHA